MRFQRNFTRASAPPKDFPRRRCHDGRYVTELRHLARRTEQHLDTAPASVIFRDTSDLSPQLPAGAPAPATAPAATFVAASPLAPPVASPAASPAAAPLRIESVDILRGLVIALMALDHVREYFSIVRGLDLAQVSLAYFLTRWVTHFCAPTFCFLAGASAYLSRGGRRTPAQLSRFLLTRGLWLVLAEVTIVNAGWFFNASYPFGFGFGLQVIWALGASMIVLAGLVRLPLWISAAAGIAMVAGHNLFDAVRPADLGAWANVWQLLHVQGPFALGPFTVFVAYPLVPWIGVMALGYAFGSLLTRAPSSSSRVTTVTNVASVTSITRAPRFPIALGLGLGLALTLAFVVLRAINGYGDPSRWSTQAGLTETVISFLNTSKYPPSLLYLLMTLGPAIAALAVLDRWKGPVARAFADFGRVPFFFYVVHLYVIHAAAVAAGWLQGFPPAAMMDFCFFLPKAYGFSLPVVYAIWIALVLALYPLCRWFAGVKARHRDQVWLSYL
jgi:uncharacterized membrane protein